MPSSNATHESNSTDIQISFVKIRKSGLSKAVIPKMIESRVLMM